ILNENQSRKAPEKLGRVKILLHNIRSMHNVGSTFRSADAFGVSELLLSGYTPVPPRTEINKTAIGAEEFVEWSGWDDVEEMFASLKKQNYYIVGLEQTENSTDFPDFDASLHENICLVFGNEVTGIDEEILPFIDEFVVIPQYGQKHSLNVSVAAGVVLYGLLQKLW
ncbi:MAG: RNA methyltransferase, partial [Balneolaceae bacterium]